MNNLSKMMVIRFPPKKPKPTMSIKNIMSQIKTGGCSACSKK
jgi:hypothetical protein